MESYTFSPVADLAVELTVDSEQHIFLVSAAVLRGVSPVWRKALDTNSGFAPLKKITVNETEYPKTTVEDITVKPLTIVFNILHHHAALVPRDIQFALLRSIAILADQYDFALALSPWSEFWINPLTWGFLGTAYKSEGFEDWLFIATVFKHVSGCPAIIRNISKRIICNLVISSNPQIRYDEKHLQKPFKFDLIPEKIQDFILEERSSRLQKIMDLIYTFVRQMMNMSMAGVWNGKDSVTISCQNPECFAIALGSLLRSIASQNLSKLLLAEQLNSPESSLSNIAQKICDLKMTTLLLERPSGPVRGSSYYLSKSHLSHEDSTGFTQSSLKTLVNTLNTDLFQNDQAEAAAKCEKPEDLFEPSKVCPLAKRLSNLQREAKAALESVKGYEIDISNQEGTTLTFRG